MTSATSSNGHGACRRCDALPEVDASASWFYLAAPEAATEANLLRYAREHELEATQDDGIICVHLPVEKRADFAETCRQSLNLNQLNDTRALLASKRDGWAPADLLRTRSLLEYAALLQHGFLLEILRENRLFTVFHPIVPCNDPATPFAYECLLRAHDGQGGIVSPARLLGVARDAQLLFQVDRAARVSALAAAAEHAIACNIFINFVPSTIYRPEFCLNTTFSAAREYGLDAGKIIFEVVESDAVADVHNLRAILDEYRAHGFKVALDDLGAGFASLNMLHELRPDVVKLDMELVRGIDKDPYKASICKTLLALANELGIMSVAEGVETVEEFEILREAGATLAQGYLFAKPASPPPLPAVPAALA